MEVFFYVIIFLIGITFGSFYTLAVYRIPKKEDITHTHSYCPNCNHKLSFLDLIPVLSYIFLRGKCRYCKEKIRPRYFILEIISGLFFVLTAYLLNFNIYNINIANVIEYSFFVLYFTFIILISGIDKEYRIINKPVLMYGIVISIMYIVYLYIIENSSIYRYIMYLVLFVLVLLIDTITLKKHKKDNYTYSVLLQVLIMVIFTGEYITISSIIMTLLAISIYILANKLMHKDKNKKEIKEKNKNKDKEIIRYADNAKIGFFLGMFNTMYLIIVLIMYKFV